MKELSRMSRVNGMFEKAFRLLNRDLFNNELEEPIITLTHTKSAYGHYTTWDKWDYNGKGRREINIDNATMSRPIECVIATLIHEMVHMYCDTVLHVKDTSRNGTYHNKKFKEEAEKRMIHIEYDSRIGWSVTSPTDELILWIASQDSLLNVNLQNDIFDFSTFTGVSTGFTTRPFKTRGTSTHSIKYQCPCCGNSVRATKSVRVACLDCDMEMIEC